MTDKAYLLSMAVCAVSVLSAAIVPNAVVEKAGAERITVSVATPPGAYTTILKRNLQISGCFTLAKEGSISVTGTPGASVSASGRGKVITSTTAFADDRGARMAARQFVDAMVKTYSDGGKGFATTRVAFINRKGVDNAELYTCYPDGYDIRSLTSDGCAAVGPRWAPNGTDIYYTSFLHKFGNVFRINAENGQRSQLAPFKGTATGAAVAPDGSRCAIILSYQGNPELYIFNFSTKMVRRMTTTPNAAEASPCWSPNGSKIAYVSDQSRHPQVYILDVATRKSVRFTNKGSENTNPDWSLDGMLVWASKRQGQAVLVVADPSAGEASARVVTDPGSWEHPSWTANGRHVVASRDKALFLVDTDPDADKPTQLFHNQGNWMNPACSR